MGQKVNPISIRLGSSIKQYDNSWYSDHFFTNLLTVDISLYNYVNSFLKFLKLPSVRLAIYHLPGSTKLYTFFCYPKSSRESKAKMFHIPSSFPQLKSKKHKFFQTSSGFSTQLKSQDTLQSLTDQHLWQKQTSLYQNKFVPFTLKKANTAFQSLLENNTVQMIEKQAAYTKLFQSTTNNKLLTLGTLQKNLWKYCLVLQSLKTNQKLSNTQFSEKEINFFFKNWLLVFNQESTCKELLFHLFEKKSTKTLAGFSNFILQTSAKIVPYELKYQNYLENYLSFFFNFHIKLIPFKVHQDWQSASFFADEIVYFLERRISFRQLKSRLLRQIMQNPKIRGIRITCSGRVGGKSKKAQRAKVESIKYGQTSLHVFSSKIDFASRTASTSLGSTGIKVWICSNS